MLANKYFQGVKQRRIQSLIRINLRTMSIENKIKELGTSPGQHNTSDLIEMAVGDLALPLICHMVV